jgi:hypothetical protein
MERGKLTELYDIQDGRCRILLTVAGESSTSRSRRDRNGWATETMPGGEAGSFRDRSRSQLTGRSLLSCPGRRARGLCRAAPDAQL